MTPDESDWRSLSPVELPPAAALRLARLLSALESHPHAPVSAASRESARDTHMADSLSGLLVTELVAAEMIADLGAGAGLPGLVLAAALPSTAVDLIEASSRKCRVALEIASAAAIPNVSAVDQRAEEWARADGRERYDAVVARAVGSLAELCELASPLLRQGGAMVAWKGARERAEEQLARAGAPLTAMAEERIVDVRPYPGSRRRHLHVYRKAGPTPADLPRRPGLAHKRPLGT